jgi:hypothetical protein
MDFRSALALGALFLAFGADLRAAAPTLEVWPPAPDAGTALRFKVHGEWPDGCVPSIRDARIEGRDIVLQAALAEGPCEATPQAYETGTEALPLERLKLAGNGVYRVRFEVRRSADAAAELHGFRLLYAGNTPDPGYVPETGFWWPEKGGEFDQAGPGLGVQLEVQSGTLSMSVYGFERDGAASWSFGAAAMKGHVAEIELSQLRHGSGPFEPFQAPKELSTIGHAHVELLTPSRATLWFLQPRSDGRGLQLQPVSMVRFRFAQEPAEAWLGRWVVLAERDDGYPTQRIDFVRLKKTARGFSLTDAANEFRLRCDADRARPNSPATRCLLSSRSGAVLEVDFDHVALNELRGWTGAGQRIVALKLNR